MSFLIHSKGPRVKTIMTKAIKYAIFPTAGILVLSVLSLDLLARRLVLEEAPSQAQAVVVLYNNVEIYPRMVRAAQLYHDGYVEKVVINGNRKVDALKSAENQGYKPPSSWNENFEAFLGFNGVPSDDIVFIEAENAFDTRGEAKLVGERLRELGLTDIIVTTNRFHSRRAAYIWRKVYGDDFKVRMVPMKNDSFTPGSWWRDSRQLKWVFYEIGSWFFMVLDSFNGRVIQ